MLLAVWGFADTIVALLGAKGEMAYLAEGAVDYLHGAALSFVGLIIGIVGFLASPFLVSLYFDNSDTAFDTTVRAFAIYVWLFPFYGINMMLQNYYMGCNSIRMTYIINTLENLVFVILAAVVLGLIFGEVGVWCGLVVGEVLAILATLVIIAVRKRRLPRN